MAHRNKTYPWSTIAAFVHPGNATAGKLAAGYLLSGILLWHVVYQSQIALATGFLEEAWTRNLLNLMVTPLRETEFVGGVAIFGMAKLVMGVGNMGALSGGSLRPATGSPRHSASRDR